MFIYFFSHLICTNVAIGVLFFYSSLDAFFFVFLIIFIYLHLFIFLLCFLCSSNIFRWLPGCLHCLHWKIGGCINASPAGKRRIASGAEQQLSSVADDALMGSGKDSTGLLSHFGSAFTSISSIAVAVCLLAVTIFVTIIVVVQVRQYEQ